MSSFLRALCLLLVVFAGGARAAAPVITNVTAVPGPSGTAVLSARITASSAAPVIVTFRYGTTVNYGSTKETTATANANAEMVNVGLTGLASGTTYHFRVEAETVEGDKTQTADQTFVQSASVTLGVVLHNATTGFITLRGLVTANGVAGTAFFQFSVGTTFDQTTPAAAVIVPATAVNQEISAPLPAVPVDLRTGPVYNFRLVFKPNDAALAEVRSVVGKSNTPPKAVADSATLTDTEPVTLNVLENDSDAESDILTLKLDSLTKPRYGEATIVGNTIVYTPTQALRSADTFRYTVVDGFTGSATATVTIRPLRATLAGTHGGLVRNAEGKAIGYFRISATALGSFTGVVVIDGKSYLLTGAFAADGSFHGAASRDGTILPVNLTTVLGDDGTTIRADFAQGRYTAEVEFTEDEATTRGPLAGRYTVALPGSTSGTGGGTTSDDGTTTTTNGTTLPEGTGWAALKVGTDGSVRVKGRLPDGRSFATRGVLVVGTDGPQITFYDDAQDTRVVGAFVVGDTITGSLRVDRARSNDRVFPDGYDTVLTVNGARYIPPDDGGGIVSSTGEGADQFTISFNGGGLSSSFSRNVQLTDAGQLKVLDGGRENLKLKVDPSSGRFTTKVTVDDDGHRVKGTGVFIQETGDTGGGGAGVFKGVTKPGSIQITAGSTPSPATPTPTTPIPFTPTPVAPTPTVNGINILRPNGVPASVR